MVLCRAAVCDVVFCSRVSVWHLQRNAWTMVASVCPCVFGSLMLCCITALNCSSASPFSRFNVDLLHPYSPSDSVNVGMTLFFIVLCMFLYLGCYLSTRLLFTSLSVCTLFCSRKSPHQSRLHRQICIIPRN